ncbi:MAG: TrkH family potassium uptake protein [Planctomycetota bacterium]|jgi:trk system potassium uptake protein TrkH|nr:TrkH family potassium uptake protein [Planctomycetota bacterium]
MRIALVLGVIGRLLKVFCFAFVPPLCLAAWDAWQGAGSWTEAGHFSISLGVTWCCGWLASQLFVPKADFRRAETLAVVAGTWMVIAHFAAVPYMFAGLSYVDSFFEAISGLTTTGATILTDFDAHGRAFFLWRSMTQWFGGLGVIALFVVVLPQLGIAGRQIFFAEGSAATTDVISPSVRQSARRLWQLYCFLTLLEVGMLHLVAGMGIYESFCHALTNVSAGGFSPHAESVGGYANPTAEWIVTGFMLLSGVSFPLIWVGFTRRPKEFMRDGEFRFYLLCALTAAGGIAFMLAGGVPGGEEVRTSLFQTASLISGTGYASTDYSAWPDRIRILLLAVMIVGGCAGSAASGPKAVRVLLSVKFMWREFTRVLHPRGVIPLRHRGRAVPEDAMRAILNLVLAYILMILVVGTVMVLFGSDFVTGFSSALACICNIGPGFEAVGPMENYAALHPVAKIILTLGMWMGRLELLTVLVLLHPDVLRRLRWRGDRRN